MNYRSKTVAMVLCFFLGLLGAHWFYLGRPQWGGLYALVTLGSWPLSLVLCTLLGTIAPAIGALFLVMSWLANLGCAVIVIYDFCCLLSMHPARFDIDYNRS